MSEFVVVLGALAAAAAITCAVSGLPRSSISVGMARIGPLPRPPTATRADAQLPEAWRVIHTPALTTT